MSARALDPSRIRDLSPLVLGEDGRMRVLSAAFWAETTMEERALFGHYHGVYSFPTVELVEYLRDLIGERKAIEIGAGHGVLSDALGIVGTDSHQQSLPQYRAHYQVENSPTVSYGPDVKVLNARDAVRRYKPDVVVACWVTHKFDRSRPRAEGNSDGVDEVDVLSRCGQYVFVGNEQVHEGKKIWALPHELSYPPFLYSRATNGTRDFIAIWPGDKQ